MKRNEGLIDETEIRKTIEQFKPNGKLFEIRIIGNGKPMSGYFTSADTLIQAFDTVDLRGTNVYMSLNCLKDSLYARKQADKFLISSTTTKDNEVNNYDWLFIDLDPERETDISSSDAELTKAKELADRVYRYMKDIGFEEPVRALSGNGCHLLYSISIGNTDENKALIERCLKALSLMFSSEEVKVDTVNHNPSRIFKLYGTMAQKGRSTSDRPHRMAMMIGDIKPIKPTSRIFLEKLAETLPAEEIKPAKYNSYSPSEFDIEDWMNEHGISYREKVDSDSVKYILDECPFDGNHKAPDSMIFKMPSGAIGFKCLHNSCADKRWQDLRIKFDPDAYEKTTEAFDRSIEEGWKRHNRDKKETELKDKPTEPVFETVMDVLNKPTPDTEYILTRINAIDKKMHGLMKGGLSVFSGLRASAKSTLVSQIALQAINDGHNVIVYSGELKDKRFVRWLLQQAAGKQYVKQYEKNGSTFYFVLDDVQRTIGRWIKDHLWLYNNIHGSDYEMVIKSIESKIEETKADLVILDNLMTINLFELDSNEYRAQTMFMQSIKRIAETYNCHIALIAHPRKTTNFLRLVDISGSANISNLIDSCFIVHRNNHDFRKATQDEFKWPVSSAVYNGTNVIEIAKDREEGIQDEFIPLWYEPESRRLKNDPTEVLLFGWMDELPSDSGFSEAQEEEIPFR